VLKTSHKAQIEVARKLKKRLSPALTSIGDGQPLPYLGVLLATALASRGILPACLKGNHLGTLVEDLSERAWGHEEVRLDQSNFANTLMDLLLDVRFKPGEIKAIEEAVLDVIKDDRLKSACQSALFVSWGYQVFMDSSRSPNTLRSPEDETSLAAATQMFTPEWVCDFLVDESWGSDCPSHTIIDPACGSGHILASALNRFANLKQDDRFDRLKHFLSHGLYGLDIDRQILKIAGLAIYLKCRDIAGIGELPLPHLYHFAQEKPQSADLMKGSLWLAVQSKPPTLKLQSAWSNRATSFGELPEQFSAVTTNPPYLSRRHMPAHLRSFLKENYPAAQNDLYAAFLQLGTKLTAENGNMSFICQQSFLSIQRYSQLRDELWQEHELKSVVILGPGSFALRGGEKINNAIVSWRKTTEATDNRANKVKCWRILTSLEKGEAESRGLAHLQPTKVNESEAFFLRNVLSNAPLTFFCPSAVRRIFSTYPAMESAGTGIVLTNGLFTCSNRKFVRKHNEISAKDQHRYVPYDKGGGYKWYHTTPYVVLWDGNGQLIRDYRRQRGQSTSLPGEQFYFQRGLTYSYIGTRGFKARLLSPNCVFDIASSALFSSRLDLLFLLGFLNSSLCRFMLGILNPTINFQIGDLRRLPFKEPSEDLRQAVSVLAEKAVELAERADRLNPQSPQFNKSDLQNMLNCPSQKLQPERLHENILAYLSDLNSAEHKIQREIDERFFDMYELSRSAKSVVLDDPWVSRSNQPMIRLPSKEVFQRELLKWC